MKILISWLTFGLVTTVLISSSIITIAQSFYLHVSNAMEMDSHFYNISEITYNDSLLNASNTALLSNVSSINANNTSNYANITDSNLNSNVSTSLEGTIVGKKDKNQSHVEPLIELSEGSKNQKLEKAKQQENEDREDLKALKEEQGQNNKVQDLQELNDRKEQNNDKNGNQQDPLPKFVPSDPGGCPTGYHNDPLNSICIKNKEQEENPIELGASKNILPPKGSEPLVLKQTIEICNNGKDDDDDGLADFKDEQSCPKSLPLDPKGCPLGYQKDQIEPICIIPMTSESCPKGQIKDETGNCSEIRNQNQTPDSVEIVPNKRIDVNPTQRFEESVISPACPSGKIPYSEGVKSFVNCVGESECQYIGGTVCNNECTFLDKDRYNCERCGNVCPGGQSCNNSMCQQCDYANQRGCPKNEVCEQNSANQGVCHQLICSDWQEPWFGKCIDKCTGGRIRVAMDLSTRMISPTGKCVCPLDKPLFKNGVCVRPLKGEPAIPVCSPPLRYNAITGTCYCPSPYQECEGQCVYTPYSRQYCGPLGMCGKKCENNYQFCRDGKCVIPGQCQACSRGSSGQTTSNNWGCPPGTTCFASKCYPDYALKNSTCSYLGGCGAGTWKSRSSLDKPAEPICVKFYSTDTCQADC